MNVNFDQTVAEMEQIFFETFDEAVDKGIITAEQRDYLKNRVREKGAPVVLRELEKGAKGK